MSSNGSTSIFLLRVIMCLTVSAGLAGERVANLVPAGLKDWWPRDDIASAHNPPERLGLSSCRGFCPYTRVRRWIHLNERSTDVAYYQSRRWAARRTRSLPNFSRRDRTDIARGSQQLILGIYVLRSVGQRSRAGSRKARCRSKTKLPQRPRF